MSRAGDDGVEDAFPAKKHIFYTGNGLDIHGTGGFHSSQITGIHDDLLTGLQVVFDNMAVKFQEYNAASGKPLHDEAFSTEESGAEPLLEEDGKGYTGSRCEKCGFLRNDFLSWPNLERTDAAGKTGCKRNHARSADGGVTILEHTFSGK